MRIHEITSEAGILQNLGTGILKGLGSLVGRRHIKTQLEVPDDRLCNAVTLSGLCNSDNVQFYFARKGKV